MKQIPVYLLLFSLSSVYRLTVKVNSVPSKQFVDGKQWHIVVLLEGAMTVCNPCELENEHPQQIPSAEVIPIIEETADSMGLLDSVTNTQVSKNALKKQLKHERMVQKRNKWLVTNVIDWQ